MTDTTATGWQDIATAPKDETGILVWGAFGPSGEDCIIAAWYDRSEVAVRASRPKGPYVWALVGAEEGMYAESLAKKWMPLPPPPTEQMMRGKGK